MDVAITKMSSKGQVVIPVEMRKDMKAGEKILVIKEKGNLILKRFSSLAKSFREDVIFAVRTEKALRRYKKGEFVEKDFDQFIEDLKKW